MAQCNQFYYDVKIFLGLSTFTKATFYVIYHMRYYVIMFRLFTILEYPLFDPNPNIAIFPVYGILTHFLSYLQTLAQPQAAYSCQSSIHYLHAIICYHWCHNYIYVHLLHSCWSFHMHIFHC